MNRGYVTAGEAGLIVFIVGTIIGTVLITMACFAEHYYRQKADVQHIDRESYVEREPYVERESDMCIIRVTAPCGDDICRYNTSISCTELDRLVKTSKRGK